MRSERRIWRARRAGYVRAVLDGAQAWETVVVSVDRRVPAGRPVEYADGQVGDSAVVWHVIEDAFWVVCAADGHLDEDFVSLTDGQRHLAVLSDIWSGIMNGGPVEPLYNSGGDFLPEAIAAARALGATTTAKLFEGIVDVVGLSLSEVRDRHLRTQALDRHECDGDHADLDALVDPASEWFERAERFIESNPDDFYV